MSKTQEISLRDAQRILTCLALFPSNFSSWDHIIKRLTVDAAILKVLHPSIYAELRQHHVSMESISKALALVPSKNTDTPNLQQIDWPAWSFALEGTVGFERQQLTQPIIDQYVKVFGDGRNEFRWTDADHYFMQAFDTFTLPSS
jgi:hypothetical protein